MALIRSIIFITILLEIQIFLAAGEPSLSPSTCDRYFITRLSILKSLVCYGLLLRNTKKLFQYCSQKCLLPDCLCMSTTAPGALNPEEIPQMVFLTFDDAVADVMYPTYQRILQNRINPNSIRIELKHVRWPNCDSLSLLFGDVCAGCNIGMTFFVTHEGTNYRLVNELFNRGNEIASHTVTYFPYYRFSICHTILSGSWFLQARNGLRLLEKSFCWLLAEGDWLSETSSSHLRKHPYWQNSGYYFSILKS